jgi:hypothetical protein
MLASTFMTDQEIAHAHRLRQAQRILDLFKSANQRAARNMEELTAWAATPKGAAALAINRDPDTGFIEPASPQN